jgi:hypothetical protein
VQITVARRLAPAAAALAAIAALAGCGVAQDAQDAVGSATADAKQQATEKAKELAVRALTTQACDLTKDGTLSPEDVRRLTGQLDAARAAGVPDQVLDLVRPLVEQGAGAGRAEVRKLRAAAACG